MFLNQNLFWTKHFLGYLNFCLPQIFLDQNFFWFDQKKFFHKKFLWTNSFLELFFCRSYNQMNLKKVLDQKMFPTQTFFGNVFQKQQFFRNQIFLDQFFLLNISLGPKLSQTQNCFGSQNFRSRNFLGPNFLWTYNCFGPKKFLQTQNFFLTQMFFF